MAYPNDVDFCEEKGRDLLEQTYDVDSKLGEGEGKKHLPGSNEGLKRGMESRHIQVRPHLFYKISRLPKITPVAGS